MRSLWFCLIIDVFGFFSFHVPAVLVHKEVSLPRVILTCGRPAADALLAWNKDVILCRLGLRNLELLLFHWSSGEYSRVGQVARRGYGVSFSGGIQKPTGTLFSASYSRDPALAWDWTKWSSEVLSSPCNSVILWDRHTVACSGAVCRWARQVTLYPMHST